jgi:hypothetical protein
MSLRASEAPPSQRASGRSLAAVLAAGEQHHASDTTDGFLFRSWRKKKLPTAILAFSEPVPIRGRAHLRDPFRNDYLQKVEISSINVHKDTSKRLIEGSIVIGRVIHTVFYAETLPSAVIKTSDQLGGEALTDLEKRSILRAVDERLEMLYKDLDAKIEEFFPENKNYDRPEVKRLQDKVDATAERRDFFEAIRLALTRVPDGHMEWPEEEKDEPPPAYGDYAYTATEDKKPKPKPKFVPSFTKEWLEQAGQAVLLEAIRRQFATVESV